MTAKLPLVFLDWQHAGKRGDDVNDRGAWGDLDHDGKPDLAEQEAYLTYQYLLALHLALRAAGWRVIHLSDGWYSERKARADKYATDEPTSLYLAAHLNSIQGGVTNKSGRYGSVFYDNATSPRNGLALGREVALALAEACPELDECRSIAAQADGWTSRAYGTIAGLRRPIALCLEPGFLDQLAHQPLWTPEGLARVGSSIATGIFRWWAARR